MHHTLLQPAGLIIILIMIIQQLHYKIFDAGQQKIIII